CRDTRACRDQSRRRPLEFSVKASVESLRYKAKYAGDRIQGTRWWGYKDGSQRLMLDLMESIRSTGSISVGTISMRTNTTSAYLKMDAIGKPSIRR
ncbi:MAG: hypothetical protein P8166_18145, partial [Candidatus Thiodiazotropha sp.]